MLFDEFISRAIEIPFSEKGRGWDGVDCWGLIVLAFKQVQMISLPDHNDNYISTRQLNDLNTLIDTNKSSWSQVVVPKPMDCVLLRIRGMPIHIGLMIDSNGNFLHAEYKRNVFIDNVNSLVWQGLDYNNIEGFYRYAG